MWETNNMWILLYKVEWDSGEQACCKYAALCEIHSHNMITVSVFTKAK